MPGAMAVAVAAVAAAGVLLTLFLEVGAAEAAEEEALLALLAAAFAFLGEEGLAAWVFVPDGLVGAGTEAVDEDVDELRSRIVRGVW